MLKLKLINSPKPLKIKLNYKFPEVKLANLQEKTIIPTKILQEVIADINYDGLSKVIVEKIPEEYVLTEGTINIANNGNYDVKYYEKAAVAIPDKKFGTKLIENNGTYTASDDNLDGYNEVIVNTPGVNINDYFTETISGSTDQNTAGWVNTIKQFPEFTIDGTNAGRMFMNYPLNNINIPDTSNVTNAGYMFQNAKKLINIPQFNTSNMTAMQNMFYGCNALISIPQLNTNKAINIGYMFYNCIKLVTVPLLNCNNVTTINSIFYNCRELTTLGGFENLGKAYLTTQLANYNYYTLNLQESSSSKITHESLMNVINNLYDIATKGVKTQKLVLGSKNLAKLTAEEIAIATNKGWSVS